MNDCSDDKSPTEKEGMEDLLMGKLVIPISVLWTTSVEETIYDADMIPNELLSVLFVIYFFIGGSAFDCNILPND
jgi:hypothetical protein